MFRLDSRINWQVIMRLNGKCRSKGRAFWENGEEREVTMIDNYLRPGARPLIYNNLGILISLGPYFIVKEMEARRISNIAQIHRKRKNANLVSIQMCSMFHWTRASQSATHIRMRAGLHPQGLWTSGSAVWPNKVSGMYSQGGSTARPGCSQPVLWKTVSAQTWRSLH